MIEYPERVREVKDYESEVGQVTISHEEMTFATKLLSPIRQSVFDLVDFRNPRTVRLSSRLEDLVKNEISLKNQKDSSERIEACLVWSRF